MHPILFELFGFPIPSFGVMMALGFLAGLYWASKRAEQMSENPDAFIEFAPWLIISAVVGARICYFFFFPDLFWADPISAIFSRGGLVWYGGMIGCILALTLFSRIRKIPFFKVGDIMAPAAALGLAFGRIGCFLAGCCFGGPCALPWAVSYPVGHETHPHTVHPAPLYESSLALVLIGIMLQVQKRFPKTGTVSWTFVAGYGLIRFFIEYARGDRLIWLEALDLSASQLISLCGVLIGVAMLIRIKSSKNSLSKNTFSNDASH